MSLIGDALRKARQEASERESNRKGILFSAKINDSPTQSNLGLGLALGALIAVIATVAGGGAVWWVVGRGASPEPAGVSEPTAPAINAAAGPEAVTPSTLTAVQSATSVEAASEESDPTSVDAREEDAPSARPQEQAPAAVNRSRGSNPEADSAIGFVGMEDGEEVFILEADLGSVQLSLDFLVSRAEDPFTEINGVELHIGGVIEGYRVKSIEHDRVKLSNGRRTIVLRAP